ncbi:NAC domain-containing protein 83 [Camellia lanceoleosa]|uniref:NAC domain-containing protein 83 n=1 Tax=Camellia lanceoleosa TaxID=1840588 RepID=A0ACC0HTX5_9ERIC|nr:NAC domain-containing protein 83 [Camellia lanceoleosa]
MNKLNIVENGGIKLPPGFRFQPTDEEIVYHYLTRKNLSCPLPASPVSEITVCNYDPWDLPGEAEQERYFFTKKEAKYQNGNRTNRIFVKKRSTKGNDEIVVQAPTENRVENQEVAPTSSSSSSSSSSSCNSRILTEEVTSIGFDHHQQTSDSGQWW